jgi:hypothetical protein
MQSPTMRRQTTDVRLSRLINTNDDSLDVN